jgi:hypothetical protein
VQAWQQLELIAARTTKCSVSRRLLLQQLLQLSQLWKWRTQKVVQICNNSTP